MYVNAMDVLGEGKNTNNCKQRLLKTKQNKIIEEVHDNEDISENNYNFMEFLLIWQPFSSFFL